MTSCRNAVLCSARPLMFPRAYFRQLTFFPFRLFVWLDSHNPMYSMVLSALARFPSASSRHTHWPWDQQFHANDNFRWTFLNILWPSGVMWWQRSGPTLVRVIACYQIYQAISKPMLPSWYCAICLRTYSQRVPKLLFWSMSLKILPLKLPPQQFESILLPYKTYTQELYQGKNKTMRDSEA